MSRAHDGSPARSSLALPVGDLDVVRDNFEYSLGDYRYTKLEAEGLRTIPTGLAHGTEIGRFLLAQAAQQRTAHEVRMEPGRDYWYHELMKLPLATAACPTEVMEADDPLYILYTSGTTGKPKGIVHTTGGYLTGVAATTKSVFDLRDDPFNPTRGGIGSLLVTVRDDGIGIPEDHHPFVVEEFSKVRRKGLKGEETVGLGLSITKKLVEIQGGKIWFESREGEGTAFFVEITKG
mgnify:CR=1 FL=1